MAQLLRHSTLLVLGILTATDGASAQDAPTWADALGAEVSDEWRAAEYRAFDFWIGEWEMNWRSRAENQLRFQAEGNWTRQRVFPILDGKALVELAWARDNPDEPSQRGFSIRYYDPARERWIMAQNWPNAAGNGSAFADQLIGSEHHGRLTMYSAVERPDSDGNTLSEHRRYNFADIRPGVGFRWDGSNSPDVGATWFTWNVVDAHFRRDLDPYGPAGSSFPGVHGKALCSAEPHGAFDRLEGVWEGDARTADGSSAPATFAAGVLLDGCGVAGVLAANGVKTFVTLGYNDRYEHWLSFSLDDRKNTLHSYMSASEAGDSTTFIEAPRLAIVDELTPFIGAGYLDSSDATARRTWTRVSDDELEIRDEIRSAADAAWTTALTYRLSRKAVPAAR